MESSCVISNVTGAKFSYEKVQNVIIKVAKEEVDIDSLLFAEILIVLQD